MQPSSIIVIDGAAEIAKWASIWLPPGGINCAIIPFTVPPTPSDIDGQLQQAYLAGARRGIEDAYRQSPAATNATLREQLHDNLEARGGVDEQNVADASGMQRTLPGKP